jgi:hypothetical protein
MLEMKLTHLPFGEKLGLLALPTRAIRATATATSDFCLFGEGDCAKKMAGTKNTKAVVMTLLSMLIS